MARIRRSEAAQARVIQWLTAIYIRLSREDGNDETYLDTLRFPFEYEGHDWMIQFDWFG